VVNRPCQSGKVAPPCFSKLPHRASLQGISEGESGQEGVGQATDATFNRQPSIAVLEAFTLRSISDSRERHFRQTERILGRNGFDYLSLERDVFITTAVLARSAVQFQNPGSNSSPTLRSPTRTKSISGSTRKNGCLFMLCLSPGLSFLNCLARNLVSSP